MGHKQDNKHDNKHGNRHDNKHDNKLDKQYKIHSKTTTKVHCNCVNAIQQCKETGQTITSQNWDAYIAQATLI